MSVINASFIYIVQLQELHLPEDPRHLHGLEHLLRGSTAHHAGVHRGRRDHRALHGARQQSARVGAEEGPY